MPVAWRRGTNHARNPAGGSVSRAVTAVTDFVKEFALACMGQNGMRHRRINMYTYINGVADHPLAMRFVSEKDGQKGLWLVFDTMNGNVVGVHKSETLAVLDAFKREQDT